MTATAKQLLLIAALVLAGAVVGWFAHSRQLNRRQTAWVDSVRVERERNLELRLHVAALNARADSAEREATAAKDRAQTIERKQGGLWARSAQLEVALTQATNKADSGTVALGLLPVLREQRDLAEQKAGEYRRAYEAEMKVSAALRERGDSLQAANDRKDVLLATGVKVVGSSGCKVPFTHIDCPEVIVGYAGLVDVSGGTVTVRHGPAVAAGWKVF